MKNTGFRSPENKASGVRIAAGWRVKTVITDSIMYDAHIGREEGRTGIAVGIKKEQRIVNPQKSPACHGPVHDIIVLLRRCHVVDILRIIAAAYGFPHADKLPCVYGSHKFDESSIKMELF